VKSIPLNTIVRVLCVNGITETGKLSHMDDECICLDLPDGAVFMVNNPKQNVLAVKFQKTEQDSVFIEMPKEELPRSHDLRTKRLAELHRLRMQAEKELAKQVVTGDKKLNIPEVSFGIPNFNKSVFKHPPKKTRR
jgi:hypothetical protein